MSERPPPARELAADLLVVAGAGNLLGLLEQGALQRANGTLRDDIALLAVRRVPVR